MPGDGRRAYNRPARHRRPPARHRPVLTAAPAAAAAACSAAPPPGGNGTAPGRHPRVPAAPPPAPPPTAIPSGADPVRNSTIQSAVSARTSSVTSSENRRSTPRHRSAASLAVPSAGPSTSRTLSDAQSNCSTCSRRCTACAVATSLIHPDVIPKNRSTATHATRQQQRQIPPARPPRPAPRSDRAAAARPRDRPRRGPAPQHPRPRRFHTRSARYQRRRVQRAPLHPPVQLVQPLGGLAPVPERKRPAGQIAGPQPGRPFRPARPGAAPRAASPAGSPGTPSVTVRAHVRNDVDATRVHVRCRVTPDADAPHPSYRPMGGDEHRLSSLSARKRVLIRYRPHQGYSLERVLERRPRQTT